MRDAKLLSASVLNVTTPSPITRGSISTITRRSAGSRQPKRGFQRTPKRIRPGTWILRCITEPSTAPHAMPSTPSGLISTATPNKMPTSNMIGASAGSKKWLKLCKMPCSMPLTLNTMVLISKMRISRAVSSTLSALNPGATTCSTSHGASAKPITLSASVTASTVLITLLASIHARSRSSCASKLLKIGMNAYDSAPPPISSTICSGMRLAVTYASHLSPAPNTSAIMNVWIRLIAFDVANAAIRIKVLRAMLRASERLGIGEDTDSLIAGDHLVCECGSNQRSLKAHRGARVWNPPRPNPVGAACLPSSIKVKKGRGKIAFRAKKSPGRYRARRGAARRSMQPVRD